jgi:uncharacterized membrane protein
MRTSVLLIAILAFALTMAEAQTTGGPDETLNGTPPLYQTPGIHLCNATDRIIDAAIATRQVKDPSLPNSYEVNTTGWYRIVPGQCYTIADALQNLQNLGEQYYVYASSPKGLWQGDGTDPDANFCATNGAAFNFEYVQSSPYCPGSVMRPYAQLIPIPGVESLVVMFQVGNVIKTQGVNVPTPTPTQ